MNIILIIALIVVFAFLLLVFTGLYKQYQKEKSLVETEYCEPYNSNKGHKESEQPDRPIAFNKRQKAPTTETV